MSRLDSFQSLSLNLPVAELSERKGSAIYLLMAKPSIIRFISAFFMVLGISNHIGKISFIITTFLSTLIH